jgi:hypothetical protein
MGKNKKRSRTALLREAALKASGASTRTQVEAPPLPSDFDEASISESDIAVTLSVLQKLAHHPDLLQSKECKELRKRLHPLVLLQMNSYERIDYGARVTIALQTQKWADALSALRACRDFQQWSKQGTIQRWVRDCDIAEEYKLRLLTAILRLSNHEEGTQSNNKHDVTLTLANQVSDDSEELTIQPGWEIPKGDAKEEQEITLTDDSKVPVSRVIYRENAAERKPPNTYDLLLHTTEPGTISWTPDAPPAEKHDIPFLKGAFALSSVLTGQECQQLRNASTKLGYRPDHPTNLEKPTGIDSCEWMVDDSIRDVLLERVKQFLPEEMAGAKLHSINPRWRFFRYGQECVYRPHIDGSWPESRMNEQGEYECDESGQTKSYFTFLIYLSDDFEGGETRYYFASPGGNGMTARGVIPQKGAVVVFPQANTASYIHEGSAVTKGIKYVVRTDVLYCAAD